MMATPESSGTSARRHPLAPLTVTEISEACRIAKSCGLVDPAARFVWCALDEPLKGFVLAWDGQEFVRRVTCAIYDRAERRTVLLTVPLDGTTHVEAVDIPGSQPQLMADELARDAESIKVDARFRAALNRRGITDMASVYVESWPAGNFGLEVDRSGRRLGRGIAFVLDGPSANPYAHPIENLVAIVDRDTGEVVEVQDGAVVPIPTAAGRYDPEFVGPTRAISVLEIRQPDGPGFTLDDGALRWGPWRMRVSSHPLEGLVIHEICYADRDRVRSIIYRASVSELVVPYGSTSLNHWWKSSFDAGDLGLGRMLRSLDPGCDCLGDIVYMDAVMVDEEGRPITIPRAICVHEEDHGILWKHRDSATGRNEVRRSRRLVVSSTVTVGNYDYGFFWYFYLDGSIEAEVKLTGIVVGEAIEPGARVPNANPMTPELAGVHHQHLFNFRLDMCVDGPANSIYEVESIPIPVGPDNPHGNAFAARTELLQREAQARRQAAPERSRCWRIVNHASSNSCGEPVAYDLIPGRGEALLLAQETASIRARAGFGAYHLWVTRFDPRERRAAGDFPNQHPGGAGLPAWVAADRSIVDEDIVLWHTVGTTHFCRPEDFPVMPCEHIGFTLKPFGFFDRNPAIDIAP